MCGIWGVFGFEPSEVELYTNAFKVAHRGPDNFQIQNISSMKTCSVAFHRLAIMGDVNGMQPMKLKAYSHITLLCNGEIYNYKRLWQEFGFEYETQSDCEIIIHLYNKFGIEKACALLDGTFAIIIVDTRRRKVMLARDTYGVRPMFYFATTTGKVAVCSEAKGLVDTWNEQNGGQQFFKPFLPGHYAVYDVIESGKVRLEELKKFHFFVDMPFHWKLHDIRLEKGLGQESVRKNIRTLFIRAVEKRLMSTRPIGSLLSGGLDSSLVAAVAARKLMKDNYPFPFNTFSIGMNQSPDLVAARKVSAHIGSRHHEVIITPEDGLQAVNDVIYAIESYDIITLRASVPMYLLAKYIKKETDTIVVMSGEGADELAQGYIYFHKQPSPEEGDKESKRILEDLYLYDILRTDRSTASHGLEVRAPFLDHAFTSYFLSLPAEMRMPKDGLEKQLLRSAFDGTDLIPDEILWRRKEGFSDGMASRKKSWYEILQDYIEDKVTDEQMSMAAQTFPHVTPRSKEAYYYRMVFERRFGSKLAKLIPYQWMPKWIESSDPNDPSARVLTHYKNDEDVKDE